MPFRSPQSVKNLEEEAGTIGLLLGMNFVGELSDEDVEDAIYGPDLASRLRSVFATASQEVGRDTALKRAVKASRSKAEAHLFVRNIRGPEKSQLENVAETRVREILRDS